MGNGRPSRVVIPQPIGTSIQSIVANVIFLIEDRPSCHATHHDVMRSQIDRHTTAT
ncbi:MAG: hypothetical protein ACLSUZ_02760 [Bifidobacterium pseudocatenulatum]